MGWLSSLPKRTGCPKKLVCDQTSANLCHKLLRISANLRHLPQAATPAPLRQVSANRRPLPQTCTKAKSGATKPNTFCGALQGPNLHWRLAALCVPVACNLFVRGGCQPIRSLRSHQMCCIKVSASNSQGKSAACNSAATACSLKAVCPNRRNTCAASMFSLGPGLFLYGRLASFGCLQGCSHAAVI